METYDVMGLSVVTDAVTGFADGTDAVKEKWFVTDAVTEFSVGKISVTEAVTNIDAHFFSKNFNWYSMFIYLSTEEYFHTL